ncbi:MAG: ABC transporter permease [Candidatus Omnitrophota bacterium]|nr:ABC transporter permease [Candidatus Omnitrophota bacterium]MDZ4242636.1 ABC transporter permease [Candidatus Omnitrophota bacterium]
MINNPIGVLSLSKREILRFFVVATQTVFPPIVSSMLFMYIFGVAIGRRIDFGAMDMNYFQFIVPGLMTMHMIASSYENTSSSLFIARWHNHIQEVLLSPLSYFEMVLGLLAGGVARGAIVAIGVFAGSFVFHPMGVAHPMVLLYFIVTISVIFACLGMMGALWAEDFNMLSVWNTYLIIPLVLLGGVFHPITILPKSVEAISHLNPMFYLVSGVRYSISGVAHAPVLLCAVVSLGMALVTFYITVYLFKIGYKLRT